MKPSPILVSLDSNERGSERAKALALAVGGDPTYELEGFCELPVDMAVRWPENDEVVYIELKEIPDFWASKSSGHLGQQILEMVAQGQPGFVAVFGSLQEVLESVPKMKMWENMSGCKKPQRRSQMDIVSDLSTARAFCADATACGVPVFFLSSDHLQAFPWILSLAKNILTGPNMASWMPRMPVDARKYQILCAIPSIGNEAATALLARYKGIRAICQAPPEELAECQVNGKRLGQAKAAKIAEVLG